mmetsp:Transcript_25356/g.37401  ORF Transcript_25356/g.37401 Transcript_25356/m.37401 type:complete len:120 (-) Transcript_25356:134-493(-)
MYSAIYTTAFWILAGVWNVSIATFLWDYLLMYDSKTRLDIWLRLAVFIFGVGYACVGVFGDSCQWIAIAGIIGKCWVAASHIMSINYRHPGMKALNIVVYGDIIWAVAFGAMLYGSMIY